LPRVIFILIILCVSSISYAKTLNVYNWANYIDPAIVREFEKQYKVKVNYDLFDSNYLLEAKLLISHGGYDVVFPSVAPFLERQSQYGLYEKIDKSKLKNYKYLDKDLLRLISKDSNILDYAIPYLWGTTGIGYNKSKIAEIMGGEEHKLDSLSVILDENKIKKFAKCGVEVLDSPADIIPLALGYFGKDPKKESIEDLQFIYRKLIKIRPYIKSINSANYLDNIANGESCLALGYSGDIIQARNKTRDAKTKIEIEFIRPKEIFELGVDGIAILASSVNKNLAYKFIDFIIDAKNIARTTNYTNYPNANNKSKQYIHPSILKDDAVYFSLANIKNVFIPSVVSAQYEKERTRIWLKFISKVENE
jgi:putrescine transport system substrate-binding protein